MTTPTPVAVEAQDMATTQAPLTAIDRCDRCGAQAYVRTQHAHGELLWCAHHYEAGEENLAPFKALDERHRLQ